MNNKKSSEKRRAILQRLRSIPKPVWFILANVVAFWLMIAGFVIFYILWLKDL